nr:hypothetical protein BaRGS_008583 [Batillaria attramentaria]
MDMADASSSSLEEEFRLAQRSSYLRIDLEAVLHNVRVLRSLCSSHTEVMAVLKANATGHGSVAIATHLVNNGIKHFAVATAAEGRDLREAGIQVYIQVFGTSHEDVDILQKFQLTPTVSTPAFLRLWATKHRNANLTVPPVVIKIDTGMSRHGCQPEELQQMMKTSEELGIPVHSLMTHFAVAWEDAEVTQCQLDLFLDTVRPYREQGVKVHVANAPAIIRGFGADLDFVRPDMSEEGVDVVQELGLKPALSWIVRPTLIKTLPAGRSVGYGHTYR